MRRKEWGGRFAANRNVDTLRPLIAPGKGDLKGGGDATMHPPVAGSQWPLNSMWVEGGSAANWSAEIYWLAVRSSVFGFS